MPLPATASSSPDSGADHPARWLGPTDLLDLEDPRLRLRVQSLTQLCKSEREKALACYAFVKRLPYGKPFKLHLRTARQVIDAPKADSADKATLLVALLRVAGIPARLRVVQVDAEMARGLAGSMAATARPIVQAWLQGRWVGTDTYIFDAAYMAGARQRLRVLGWDRGFGIHRAGDAIWNGQDDAWLGAIDPAADPMVRADLGTWHDPQGYVQAGPHAAGWRRAARTLRWNLLAPFMQRTVRQLRADTPPAPVRAHRKPS